MARHSGTSLVLQFFAIGCGFLFAAATARILGPRGYGVVAFALSVANIAATVALLGANALAVREVGAAAGHSDWNRLRAFVKWSISTVFVTSAIGALIVAVLSTVTGPYRSALLLSSIGVPLVSGLLLLRGVNQGARRIFSAQLPMDVLRWIITIGGIAYLIASRASPSPTQILGIVILSYAVALTIAGMSLRRFLLNRTASGARKGKHGSWLAASLPFLMVAVLGIAATEMNTLLLGSISGPREAGLYQPLARLAPLMLIAKEAIDMPLAPRMATMWESNDRDGLIRLIRRSAIAATAATALVALAILAASRFIFAAFGPEFEAVRGYLFWIAAAQVANTAFGPSPLLLAMAGDMRRRIQAQAVTLVVQAALTIALVPPFGIAGAVIALSVQMVAWSAVHWFLAKKATGLDTSVACAVHLWLRERQGR